MLDFNIVAVYGIAIFIILSLAAVSAIFSERVGIVNISINGMMIVGATLYGTFAIMFKPTGTARPSSWLQIPLILISAIGTMMFSWIHGLTTIKLKANHIISGMSLNLLAIGIAWLSILFIAPNFTGSAKSFGNPRLRELAFDHNPLNGDWGNVISLKTFILIILVVVSWFALNKTKWGLRFKSIGENPQAADVVGINVDFYKWQGVSISGFISGIAGSIAIQFFGISNFVGSINGFGFLALAIMIMARWRVEFVVIVSIFFSLLYSIGINLNGGNELDNYLPLFRLIPFVMTIVVLLLLSKNSTGPKAAGVPYDKSKK